MEAKSISEMTAEEINREIAERRGWVYDCYGWFDCTVNGRSILEGHDSPPDYREWQHAGPLLEELVKAKWVALEYQGPKRWAMNEFAYDDGGPPDFWPIGADTIATGAIARAWLAWDRGKDDA